MPFGWKKGHALCRQSLPNAKQKQMREHEFKHFPKWDVDILAQAILLGKPGGWVAARAHVQGFGSSAHFSEPPHIQLAPVLH